MRSIGNGTHTLGVINHMDVVCNTLNGSTPMSERIPDSFSLED